MRCHRPSLLHCASLVASLAWTSALSAQAVAPAPEPAPVAAGNAQAAGSPAADPAPEVQAQYRDVVARAVTEFDGGRWAEARALFLRAHELWPSARTFRTLGMTSFELRAYAQALQELQAALDDPRRPLPDEQRTQVRTLIDQTRPFVGRYRVKLSPPEAELRVDGAPVGLDKDGVLVLEVGRHELRARAAGHSELMRRLDVRGREDDVLALELAPEPGMLAAPAVPIAVPVSQTPPAEHAAADSGHGGRRLWTWIAAGTAVALAGTSTALWFISDSKYDAQLKACQKMPGMACQRGKIETSGIQDTQTAHQVTAVLAGVAGAAAVALFFIEGSSGEQAPSVAISPAGVYARGRF